MRASLILSGGPIITMGLPPGRASAVAMADGRIVYVGDEGGARSFADASTEWIRLDGRAVLPGFIDAHTHVVGIGDKMRRIPLGEARSIPRLLSAVRERATQTPRGQWVMGNGEYDMFHEERLPERRLPTLAELDVAAPDHPVFLTRGDDAALLNSLAMRLTGVASASAALPEGAVVRDADGRPTGLLLGKEGQALMRAFLPNLTHAQRATLIQEMVGRFHAAGVTSVVDCGLVGQFQEDWPAYARLHAAGALRLRITLMVRLDTGESLANILSQIDAMPYGYGHGDNRLRVGALKLIFDGEITTAWMRAPYPGRPDYWGRTWIELPVLRAILTAARGRRWPVAVHTMGGAAIDTVIAALAEVFPSTGDAQSRHLLMHAFFPSASNLSACKQLGIVLSVQPLIFYVYGPSMVREWGEQVAAAANPLRDVLASGVMAGGGTDTIPFDPLLSIWSAATRTVRDGSTLGRNQAISPEQALWLHTLGAALVTGEERHKGSIEEGKLADLVVLSRDPLSVPADQLRHLRVEMTVAGGEIVYRAG